MYHIMCIEIRDEGFNLKNACLYLYGYKYIIILHTKLQCSARYSNESYWIRLTHCTRCINLNLKIEREKERVSERERERE